MTASKRETTVDKIPSSISVQDEIFIEDHGIETTEEMTRFVPNVYYKTGTSGDAFVSRGISTIDTSLYSPMGFYVDDVPQALSYMQDFTLFDVKRVEVLRGPQSTLYGKNSSSGVINVVLSRPDNEISAKIAATAGEKHSWKVGTMASGPLIKDHLYLGLSVLKDGTNGYLENLLIGDNTADEQDNLSARGTIRWTPIEKIDVSLVLNKTDNDMGIGHLRYETGPYVTAAHKIYSNIRDRADQDRLGQSLHWKYQFERAELLSITSHQNFTRSHRMDSDRSPVPLGLSAIEIEQDGWTQEFRLSSSNKEGFFWLTGFYYNRDKLDNDWILHHINPGIANKRFSESTIDDTAVFGQVTLPFDNAWDATIGLRLDHYSGDGSQIYTSKTGSRFYQVDLSETKLLPMASLTHSFTHGIKAYLLFSTGWLTGGYDYYTATSKKNFFYNPEYTQNYEVGIKTALWDNRMNANLAFFYTDIKDKQVKRLSPQGGLAWTLTNAAQAHTTGVELEIRANPLDNLECFANLGYARAEFDEWVSTSIEGVIDYSGKRLPWAPDLTVNIGMGYYADNGWYGTTNLFWAGKQYFDAANTLEDNSYVLVNLKIGYHFDHFDISLFCKNLFDETYAQKKVNMGRGLILVEDSQPRTLGANLVWRF